MSEYWADSTLGEIYDVRDGTHDSPKYQEEGYALITSKNLKNGNITYDKVKFISESDYININKRSGVDVGDILFAMIGTIGNPVVIKTEPNYSIKNVALFKVPDEQDSHFLKYYLESSYVKEKMQKEAKGTTQKFVGLGYLRSFPIRLPLLSEQKRIVTILDEAFAGIDAAIANTENNLANACELFESYLNAVFTNEGKGWSPYKLVDLTTKIGSGATPKGGEKSYKTEGISLFRSMNVYDRRFTDRKLAHIGDEQASKLSNVIVEEGDVLFNITGASITRCCITPKEYLPARVNQHVSILRPKLEKLDTNFLCYLMTSRIYKDKLLGIGDEGGATRQAITKAQLQELVITIPDDLNNQREIIQQLDALAAETLRLESIYKQKYASLIELKQSLLQKAFSGELTAETDQLKEEAVA